MQKKCSIKFNTNLSFKKPLSNLGIELKFLKMIKGIYDQKNPKTNKQASNKHHIHTHHLQLTSIIMVKY